MWEDNDPEVEEIANEQGKRYVRGSWRGWTDSLGRWNPNMHCPAHEQDRINQLVMQRKLEKAEEAQRAAEEAARGLAAPEALAEPEGEEGLLTARQTAEGAGVSPSTVYEAARAGRLPSIRRDWRVFFRREDVEEWAERREPGPPEAQGIVGEGQAGEGGPRATTVLQQLAGAFGGTLTAGAGTVMAGLGLALSPLGPTGGGVTQVADAVMNLLVSAVNSLAMLGAGVLSLALGTVLAGAVAASAAVVLVAVSGLFGRIAETITEAMGGVVRIVRDLFDTAIRYAQSAMQLVYFGGQTPGAAVGLMAQMQAFGIPPETTAGMFGTWQMRPEFLGPRLAALGVPMAVGPEGETDWAAILQGMRTQVGGLPPLMRYPMLAATLGPQAAQQLLPMVEMEEAPFQEALRRGEELEPLTEELRAIREELVPLRGQFELLTTMVKVDLIEAVLAPVASLLGTLLDTFAAHRQTIEGWLNETATQALRHLLLGIESIVRHIPQVVGFLQGIWGLLSGLVEVIEWPWSAAQGLADWMTQRFAPTEERRSLATLPLEERQQLMTLTSEERQRALAMGEEERAVFLAARTETPLERIMRGLADKIHDVAEHLESSPREFADAFYERQRQEGDTHHYVHILPSPEFLVKLEEYLAERAWRNIQLAVG